MKTLKITIAVILLVLLSIGLISLSDHVANHKDTTTTTTIGQINKEDVYLYTIRTKDVTSLYYQVGNTSKIKVIKIYFKQ